MANGRVYWITGLSNSGKTTIGLALYYRLRKTKNNVIILDGDIMKDIASGTESAQFGDADRIIRAKRYSQIAKILSDQGTWVIVCAIAMYDEIREWNRENLKGYVEVFLDTPDSVLKERDRKGLYTKSTSIQLPKNPDMVFSNDGEEAIRDIVDKIIVYIPKNEEDYDRDREYWNAFYKSDAGKIVDPSNFAVTIETTLPRGSHILELGCGSGRDSLYFLSKGHEVTAVDGSDAAIDMLCDMTADYPHALFVCDNFVKCKALYQLKYDCIYSRFTLHSITEEQENELLSNVRDALSVGGVFCIEARTIHDEIFGCGTEVAHNAYEYNDHFRRFINVEEFVNKLKGIGFTVQSIEESSGFSKTQESDPVLMRCIATIK